MNATARKLTLILGSNVTGAMAGLRQVGAGVSSLSGRLVRVGAALTAAVGFAGLTVGAVSAGKAIISLGANMENTRLVYQTMLGSVDRGNAMLQKLDQFSNSTPFSGDEVNRAAKTLLGYGVEAGRLIPILKTVGDTASGSGKNFNELAAIFGKVFAKGKLETEQLNQLVEAGIPIMKQLQQQYNKGGAAIYAMAKKGKISADDVTKAFAAMTGQGGVFENMMEKQSGTMIGLWSAFTGQLEYAAALLGEQLAPLFKTILGYLVNWADNIARMAQTGELAANLATFGVYAVQVFGNIAKIAYAAFEGIRAAFQIAMNAMSGIVNSFRASFLKMAIQLSEAIGKIAETLGLLSPEEATYNRVVNDRFKNYVATLNRRANSDFKAAGAKWVSADQNIEDNDARVDATVDKITTAIMKWNADVQSNVVKQAQALNQALGDGTGAISNRGEAPDLKKQKLDVDQLTRVGLYNFGDKELRSLDQERNSLLVQIRDKISGSSTRRVLT